MNLVDFELIVVVAREKKHQRYSRKKRLLEVNDVDSIISNQVIFSIRVQRSESTCVTLEFQNTYGINDQADIFPDGAAHTHI